MVSRKTFFEFAEPPLLSLNNMLANIVVDRRTGRTLALVASGVNADRRHQDGVDDSEAAFAVDIFTLAGQDSGIVQDGRLVHKHASTVDRACERHLVRVEVLKA